MTVIQGSVVQGLPVYFSTYSQNEKGILSTKYIPKLAVDYLLAAGEGLLYYEEKQF